MKGIRKILLSAIFCTVVLADPYELLVKYNANLDHIITGNIAITLNK